MAFLLPLQFVAMIITPNAVSSGYPTLSLIAAALVEHLRACPFVEIALKEEITKTMTSTCFCRKPVELATAATLL